MTLLYQRGHLVMFSIARTHPFFVAVFGLFLAFLIGTYPYWGQGNIVPMDAKNHFYPMLRWLAGELHAGRFPDFMAEIYAGRSTLADPQSMITSPGFLALAALSEQPSILAMDMLVLFELYLGGVALLLIARGQNISMLAAFVGALVFMFGGLPASRLQHTLLVQSYAFLPWVLLAIDLVVKKPSLLRGAVLGMAMGMLVLGRDHVAFLAIFAAIVWSIARVTNAPSPWQTLSRSLPAVFVAIVLAIVIALPALSASVAFLGESNRPAFGFDIAARGHLTFFSLLTLFVPDLFGTLDGVYWGPGHWQFKSYSLYSRSGVQIYAGLVVPIAFALALCVKARRGDAMRYGCALGALSLLYALGNATPVYWVFYEWVPGVDKFRRSSDAGFILNLGFAFVVTAALNAYMRDGFAISLAGAPRHRVLLASGTCALFVGIPAALSLWVAVWHEQLSIALPEVALFLFLACIAGVLFASGSFTYRRRLQVLGLCAVLTIVDLCSQTIGTRMNARPVGSWAVLEDPTTDPRAIKLLSLLDDATQQGPMRAEILGFGGPWQNLPLILDVQSTLGYNPFRSGRYDSATGARQNSHTSKRKFGAQQTGFRSPLTDLLGVAVIALGKPMEQIDEASAPFFGDPIIVGDGYFYLNPRAVPRTVLIPNSSVLPLTVDQAEGRAALPDLDFQSSALAAPISEICDQTAVQAGSSDISIAAYEPGQIDTVITATAPSLVVLHERRRPGWIALVDGEERALVAANGIFQAVPVCPGEREVQFVFRQPWISWP